MSQTALRLGHHAGRFSGGISGVTADTARRSASRFASNSCVSRSGFDGAMSRTVVH